MLWCKLVFIEKKSVKFKFLTTFLITNLITGLTVMNPVITVAQPLKTPLLIAQQAQSLDEEIIRQTMKAINEAENREDIDSLLKFLVPFSISEITVEHKGNILTTTLEGINAHRRMLKNTFSLVQERETLNDYMTVRITSDGQIATVTRIIVENLTTKDDKNFIASGTDIIRFALIDNQPKIISIRSKGWLEERPQQ